MDLNIKFEDECCRCCGESRWSGRDCERCGGSGRVTTTLGEELLEFLENQKLRDAVEAASEKERVK